MFPQLKALKPLPFFTGKGLPFSSCYNVLLEVGVKGPKTRDQRRVWTPTKPHSITPTAEGAACTCRLPAAYRKEKIGAH